MNTARLTDRFIRYVSCGSESKDERRFCELIEAELTHLGFSVKRDCEAGEKSGSNGWNVYAYLPGQGEPILFSAHMDTVPPGVDIRPVVKDGVIRTSGDTVLGADDKSGIASVLEAVEMIKEQNLSHRPIEVLFSVCEELGLLGAKHADYSNIKSKQALVLDSSRHDSIVNEAPAKLDVCVEITGKAAHAATSPDKGISAIKAAAAAIANIPCGVVDEYTVINVANFLSPGKSNVVPEKASFDIDMRSFDNERLEMHVANVEAALKAACQPVGASYKIDVDRRTDILFVPPNSPIIERLQKVCADLRIAVKIEKTYGGSDATWLFHNGIEAVNFGTGMTDVHSTDEHISIADLETTTKIVLAMMR